MINIGPTATKIISTLDSSTALSPLVVMDSGSTIGRTIMAKKEGGEHEGREKFIEEAGTSLFWLGGIPVFRKIFDKTYFKWKGLDPNISIKNIIKKGSQQLKELPEKGIMKPLSEMADKYKFAHGFKLGFSVLVPYFFITYVVPKLNQGLSRKIILNRALENKKKTNNSNSNNNANINLNKLHEKFIQNINAKTAVFYGNNKNAKNLSFKGWGTLASWAGQKSINLAAGSQLNPVGNLLILDLGLGTNRVVNVARNKQESCEYGVKESAAIFFFFAARSIIKKGINKLINVFNLPPIDLDYKTLSSEKFVNKMNEVKFSGKIDETLTKFTNGDSIPEKTPSKGIWESIKNIFSAKTSAETKPEKNIVDFAKKHHGDSKYFTIDAAKELGMIKTVNGKIDKNHHIEAKNIQKLNAKIETFAQRLKESHLSTEQFIKRSKNIKSSSIAVTIGACIAALGFLVPKIQYLFREKYSGNKGFPGIQSYEAEAQKILNS